MAIIPEAVYETVEKKLRQRQSMIRKAEEALARAKAKATDISAPSGRRYSGKGGKPGSRTERGAIILMKAEKRVETARAWEAVFREMDRIYPPEDSNEGFVASMIYGNGISQAELARITGCSRQTIRLRQDRYVIRTAFVAALAGLIGKGVNGEDGGADQTVRGAETD